MGCCKSKQKDEDDKASILPSQSSTNVNVKTQEPEPEVDYAKWTPEECTLTLDPEHPLGDIFLTVHHIVTDNELVVRLRRARHLDHVSETANPYFELSLFPDPNKEYLLKSEVKRGTFDPVVDDLFRFPKITEEEFNQKVLRIVAHDELRSPTYIGEVVIELSKMGYDLLNPRWVPLRKGNGLYPPLPVSEGPSVLETPPSPSTSPKNGLLSFVPGLSNLPSLPSLPSMPGMPNMPNMPSMPSIPHLSIPGRSKHDKHDDTFSVAQSVMSSMSNTSTAALVKDIEYGKVHLSLYLDPLKRVLKVVVISARLNKTSSPDASVYVKLKMIPDPANKSKQKTKTHKGMEPVFNDSFEFQLEKADERRLQVTVWEEERMGHNVFRGECIIALTGVDSHEPSAQWHVLHSQAHGELLCRLSYDLQTDYLSVTVIKGRDLISSKGGAIDPYTKIYLLPDKKKKSKKKTRCRKHTTNPEFNETVQYFLAEFEEGRQRVLHVSVLNHNSVGNNDVIGSFSVGIREIMESQAMEQWFPLIKEKAGPGHFA